MRVPDPRPADRDRAGDTRVPVPYGSSMRITLESLRAVAIGCTILGGGGGGDPRIGQMMAEEAIQVLGPVDVYQLEDLDPDDLILPCGMIGAPTVMVEKIPNGGEGRAIRDVYEDIYGREFKAVMPFEMGGINGYCPSPGQLTPGSRSSMAISWVGHSPSCRCSHRICSGCRAAPR